MATDPTAMVAVAAFDSLSSSSRCRLAIACRSDQVNFLSGMDDVCGLEVSTAVAFARASKGLTNFFGAGKETGVYAVP